MKDGMSEICANVYFTNRIIRMDVETGAILGGIDLEELAGANEFDESDHGAMLNGIAVDCHTKTVIVTGKNWRHFIQIQIQYN